MSRGALPTYTRISHIPNLLEAYRYLTRRNLTTLSAELAMSYHTVRRLCTTYSAPQERTLKEMSAVLGFINIDTWKLWKEYCESALYAEHQGDLVQLTTLEAKLRALIPVDDLVPPLHILTECSIEAAKKLHTSSISNKTYSFYLSNLHSEAMDLLGIRRGVTKSELLRQMIDQALSQDPDVLEALIRSTLGIPAEVRGEEDEKDSEVVIIKSEEELATLVPSIPVEETISQLTAILPEEPPQQIVEPSVEIVTAEPLQVTMDYGSDDDRVDIEVWAPTTSIIGEGSNLSDEELAELFSGES